MADGILKFMIGHLGRLKWLMSQMADGILKFMISHLGPGSNVQLGPMDFKVLQ